MTDTVEFSTHLLRKLRERRQAAEAFIVGGGIGSMEEYKRSMGMLEAYADAIDIIKDALRNVEAE